VRSGALVLAVCHAPGGARDRRKADRRILELAHATAGVSIAAIFSGRPACRSAEISRRRLDLGPSDPTEQAPQQLRCPYCEHEAARSEMHTEETVAYLKRFVVREYVQPMLNNAFSGLAGSLGRGSRGGFISVRFEHTRSHLVVRPIHGPEPADFVIVEFLCCGKKMKVRETWQDVRSCIFCGAEAAVL